MPTIHPLKVGICNISAHYQSHLEELLYQSKIVLQFFSKHEKQKLKLKKKHICYVIVFIVSYREITNSRFSLTQSKPCIFWVSGPNKSNKERLK